MTGSCCSEKRTGLGNPRVRSLYFAGHSISWCVLLLLPKCPACLAVHLTLWSGIGLSVSQAGQLRAALVMLCLGVILYPTFRSLRKAILWKDRHRSLRTSERYQCTTVLAQVNPLPNATSRI